MKKIMGIDYGDARTGIAVSDLLCSIVGNTTVIHSRNAEKTIDGICTIIKEQGVGEIVVGLPKNQPKKLLTFTPPCDIITLPVKRVIFLRPFSASEREM